jgi:OFA family oxalate/formate antiporter-like MFS transporter
MLYLGIGFLVVVVLLAQFLAPPPKGFVPRGTPSASPGASAVKKEDTAPLDMLRTWQFYVLWFMYACGAGAGLMIISKVKMLAATQAGLSASLATLLVSVLAIGNGAGRIGAGMLSDRIGRKATLFMCFLVQAAVILTLSRASVGSALATPVVMAILCALVGANYGANLSLFPSVSKDYYGLKNFGVNYGLLFTAWGLGGFALSLYAGSVYDKTKSFDFAYYCSAALLVAAALVTFLVRAPQAKKA